MCGHEGNQCSYYDVICYQAVSTEASLVDEGKGWERGQ
jgi:hypothetical protein